MAIPFRGAPRKGTIVCYGDSNTYGYDPTNLYEACYSEEVIWTNYLAGQSQWRVLNYGVCGREIPHTQRQILQVRRLLPEWVRDANAAGTRGTSPGKPSPTEGKISAAGKSSPTGGKLSGEEKSPSPDERVPYTALYPVEMWIMLGTNDLLKHAQFRAEDVAGRMESLLRGLYEEPCVQEGLVRLRLIAPPRMESGAWTFEDEERLLGESRRLGEVYGALAERLEAEGLEIDFTNAAVWALPVAYDGVHLSEEGHLLLAEHLLKELS